MIYKRLLSVFGLPEPTTLSAPTYSLDSGSYIGSQTVALGSAEGATICYTSDGSAPSASSFLYTEPMVVSASLTIKAIAISDDGSSSSTAERTYSIDPYVIPQFVNGNTATYWQFARFVPQRNNFTYTVDVKPSITAGTNGVINLGWEHLPGNWMTNPNAAYKYGACSVRFEKEANGRIQAYDGIRDAAETAAAPGNPFFFLQEGQPVIIYEAGRTYTLAFIVNWSARTYSVTVSVDGAPSTTLVTDYNFRASTENSPGALVAFNTLSLYSFEGGFEASNNRLTAGVGFPPPIATAAPVIADPNLPSAQVATQFSYQIDAINSPTGYSVTGQLPPGLALDTVSGIISGTPTDIGVYPVTLRATNAAGVGQRPVTLTIAGGWRTPVPAKDALDGIVDTEGTLVTAKRFGTSTPVTVNGVTFVGNTKSNGSGTPAPDLEFFVTPGTASPNLHDLYNGVVYGLTDDVHIVHGLVQGNTYMLQWFFADERPSYNSRILDVTIAGHTINFPAPLTAAATKCYFKATGRSQDIAINMSPLADGHITAYQIRQITPGDVVAVPVIVAQTPTLNISNGGTASLLVTATGGGNLTYVWYQGESGDDTSPIENAFGAIFTTPPLTSAASYWVRVTNSAYYADSVTIIVNVAVVAVTIVTQPTAATIITGTTATLSVTATGGGTLTYEWYQGESGDDTSPIENPFGASFTTPPLTATTSYWVRVANSAGALDSAAVTVTVVPPPKPIINSPASSTANVGEAFIYQITATNSPTEYSVPGQLPPGLTLDEVTGIISGTPTDIGDYPVTLGATNAGGTGQLVVSLALNGGWREPVLAQNAQNTIVSTEGTLVTAKRFGTETDVTVNSVIFDGSSQSNGSGTAQTAEFFVATGGASPELIDLYSNLVFNFTGDAHSVTGLVPGNTYMLQWFYGDERTTSSIPARTQTVTIAGNTITFPAPLKAKSTKCYFKATAATHAISVGMGSNTGHMMAFQVRQLTPGGTVIAVPTITTQPTSQTIASGATTTLSVTATTGGGYLTYEWYQGALGVVSTPVGLGTASLITSALTATTSYWVRVSNIAGDVNSAAAVVAVTAVAPTIATAPTAATIASGATTTLSVTATGTAPLSYAWYLGVSGVTTTPVGTGASFITSALTATTSYWVRVTNSAGGVDSVTAVVTVIQPEILQVGGLLGKFFTGPELNLASATAAPAPSGAEGPWRVAARAGNIGTLPLTTTNESAPRNTGIYGYGTNNYDGVRLSTGMPTPAHMYGRHVWPNISYGVQGSNTGIGNNFGFIAIGYFTPPVTGSYTFYTTSDDNSGVWIGDLAAATTGRTPVNATVNNNLTSTTGRAAKETVGSPVALTAGVPVAIRIVHEEWYGGEQLMFSWSGPPGYNKTTDLTAHFSHVIKDGVPTGNYLSSTLAAPPTITVQPTAATIASGATTTLSVTATGTAPLSYAWYQGESGTTTTAVGTAASFTTPALTATTSYWVRVSNSAGGVDSVTAVVTVVLAPTIVTSPVATTIASGTVATLSVTATGSAPLAYQWYLGESGTTTAPAQNGTGASFTTLALTSPARYWVRVTNSGGSVNSAAVTVTITPPVPVIVNPPLTTADVAIPFSYQIDATNSPTGYSVTGALPGGLTLDTFTGLISGTPTDVGVYSITLSATNTGGVGQRAVTLTIAGGWRTPVPAKDATDDAIVSTEGTPVSAKRFGKSTSVTVNGVTFVGNTQFNGIGNPYSNQGFFSDVGAASPEIIELYNAFVYTSATATYNVGGLVSGQTYMLQWFFSDERALANTRTQTVTIAGNTITFPGPLKAKSTKCYFVATSTSVNIITAGPEEKHIMAFQVRQISGVAAPVTPTIATAPIASTINSGATTTLTVAANGGGTLTYAWYSGARSNTSTPVGQGTASFTTPALTATTSYWVRVTNSAGYVDSAAVIVTVLAVAPTISGADTVTGTVGTAFSYQITASGAPTSFA